MADVKISALPAATTPLDGTELAPIVQSGTTKRVTVANLTVGRALTASSLTLTTPLSASNGGTGQSSYATGDLLYASDATTLSKLADVATGNALISGGVGTAPSWGKVGLTTHVSGTLPVANGGTGITSFGTGVATALGNAVNGASGICVQDASGNLGLGVTPSAWGNGGNLQILNNISLQGAGSFSANAYYNAGWKYIQATQASQYAQDSGQHRWFTAPSGSAGSAISFTQAMTLDAGAYLTVGDGTGIRAIRVNGANSGTANGAFLSFGFSGSYTSAIGNQSSVLGGAFNQSLYIYNGAGDGIKIGSNGYTAFGNNTFSAEYARITSDGDLLVGATSSAISGTKLQVRSTDTNNPTAFFNVDAASSTAAPGVNVRKYDNNITTAQTFVTFAYNQGTNGAGGIQGNGTNGPQFYNSSDERLKENIVDLSDQLAKIVALKPRVFDLIDGAKNNTGFIAQEMQSVYPEFVGEDDKGFLTIGGVGKIDAYIVKAIQELAAKVSALEAKQ